MASEKIINQKKDEVSKLAAKIKEAKIVLLTDYRGINVADVTELRAELRKSNSEYKVIKNNITKRALAEAGIEGLEDLLEGPTAVIMNNDDYLETAKTIYNYSKDNDFYKIKGGVIDGKEVTMQVKVGDKVIYSKYAGTDVELEGEKYIVVKQSDILAIVEA